MGFWKAFVDGVMGVPDPVEPASPPPVPVVVNDNLLEEVMGWVRSGSRVDPETHTAMRLAAEDAALMAEAFTGQNGRKRLMIFARMSVLRPPSDVMLPAEIQASYAALRQGQDSMFAALVHYLDVHSANLKANHDRANQSDPADERFTGTDFDPAGSIAVR